MAKSADVVVTVEDVEHVLGSEATALRTYIYAHQGEFTAIWRGTLRLKKYAPTPIIELADIYFGEYLNQLTAAGPTTLVRVVGGHLIVHTSATAASEVRQTVIDDLGDIEKSVQARVCVE